MKTKERILTARVIEKVKSNPEYAEKIGIVIKNNSLKKSN